MLCTLGFLKNMEAHSMLNQNRDIVDGDFITDIRDVVMSKK